MNPKNYIITLLVLILLTSCSKTEKQQEKIIKPENIRNYESVLELSLEKKEIIEPNIFMQQMRERNITIYAGQLNILENMEKFYKVKNITSNTKICFEDIDCPYDLRCITACRINGIVKACSIDDFKDMEGVEFKINHGYCIKWKQRKDGGFINE